MRNPADGAPLGEFEVADATLVDTAVTAAATAAPAWRRCPPRERAWYLNAIADAIEDNADVLAAAETADTGMTLQMTRGGHLPRSVAHLRWYAGEAERQSGECVSTEGAYLHMVERVPLGTIAVMAPWNAPLAVASLSAAAALASGNTCVLKPSERAPLTISMLAEIAERVGLPEGVLNVVHGDAETGRALVSHPNVAGVCFVGGAHTGREVLRSAALQLKRVVLELGGKSPTIVLGDADLDAAVDGALLSAFSSNGEVCTAGSRIIVEAPIAEEFATRFIERTRNIRVGLPTAADTEMGPLIDEEHLCHVEKCINDAQVEGATLACGGTRLRVDGGGCYLRPAVLTGVRNDMHVARTEVFGPVAAILRAADVESAMTMANDTAYGLAATVWTANISRGLMLAAELQAGSVGINCTVVRDHRVPFGGMKISGLGRVGGRIGLEQFTDLRVTTVPVRGFELPRLGLSQRERDQTHSRALR